MPFHITRRSLVTTSLAFLAQPTLAAPRQYELAAQNARITYTFLLNDAPVKGVVPLDTADLVIDPQNLSSSRADVTADIRRARTGLIFATEALKSPSVLDADRFPLARFKSRRVKLGPDGRLSNGATLSGDLTLRGKTRPIELSANVFRASGTASNDFSNLSVNLTGQLSRAEFGATGYQNLVADVVRLDITADIRART